jgi:hypothetical protein
VWFGESTVWFGESTVWFGESTVWFQEFNLPTKNYSSSSLKLSLV